MRTVASCLLLFSLLPHAAAGEDVDTITVTATRADRLAGETPQKITVITREEIERQIALGGDQSQLLSNLIPS